MDINNGRQTGGLSGRMLIIPLSLSLSLSLFSRPQALPLNNEADHLHVYVCVYADYRTGWISRRNSSPEYGIDTVKEAGYAPTNIIILIHLYTKREMPIFRHLFL